MSARWKPFMWWRLGVGVVLAGLAVNAWVQAGTVAFLVILLASVAVLATVGTEFLISGYSAAHHSKQQEKAIKAIVAARRQRRIEAANRRAAADVRNSYPKELSR